MHIQNSRTSNSETIECESNDIFQSISVRIDSKVCSLCCVYGLTLGFGPRRLTQLNWL